MAGHDNRNRIAVVGHPDGPEGMGMPDCVGDIAVAAGFPVRDIEQRAPALQLESSSAQVEWKRKLLPVTGEVFVEFVEPRLKSQRGYIVEVQGFSSGHGQTAIANSQKMAESVVRYLVLNHEIPVYRIYLVGMGNAPVQAATTDAPKPKRLSGGRVEISLLKNNLEQLASSGTAPATSTDQQQPAK